MLCFRYGENGMTVGFGDGEGRFWGWGREVLVDVKGKDSAGKGGG